MYKISHSPTGCFVDRLVRGFCNMKQDISNLKYNKIYRLAVTKLKTLEVLKTEQF